MTNEELYQKAVEVYGESSQIDMCVEEMSELIKALLKHRRYICSEVKNAQKKEQLIKDVIEEIVDTEIMLEQLKIIYAITTERSNTIEFTNKETFDDIKKYKIKRLENNFKEERRNYY